MRGASAPLFLDANNAHLREEENKKAATRGNCFKRNMKNLKNEKVRMSDISFDAFILQKGCVQSIENK